MSSWIFQGNPEIFDIEGYLKAVPGTITWFVSRYANEIRPGDVVYIWKSQGNQPASAGIVAEATVIEAPRVQPDDPRSAPFWRRPPAEAEAMRVRLRLNRVASAKEVLKRDWMKDDSVLSGMLILNQAAGTNFRLNDAEADRLGQLWRKTGTDWQREEVVAALWAFEQLRDKPISRTPGSLVEQIAQKIGRAPTGVYNKLMNLRAIDPTDSRAGLAGGSKADERTWEEFFDPAQQKIDGPRLEAEYDRLWGGNIKADIPVEVAIASAETALSQKPLKELLEDYKKRPKIALPKRRAQQAMTYDRDPRVVVLRKRLANYCCEVAQCSSDRFQVSSGEYFVEVHHLTPLAEGGADILENTVALCPTHHRLLHHAKDNSALLTMLRMKRASENP